MKRRREVEHLSTAQLETALEDAIVSQGTSELALMYLMNHYDFDFHILESIFVGRPL
jgi:hypothetical protein